MNDDPDVINEARQARGRAKLAELTAGPGTSGSVMETLRAVAPHMERQVLEFVLGDVLSRPGLDTKTRELLNVAVLTAIGAETELELHAHAALNVGCRREEVVEAVAQQAVYAGFPRAINGIKVLERVFAAREAGGDGGG